MSVSFLAGSKGFSRSNWRASALGHALAEAKRPLIYGGGAKGIMGVVSTAVLERDGRVTGIVPSAMVAAGGEGGSADVILNEPGREKVSLIVVFGDFTSDLSYS